MSCVHANISLTAKLDGINSPHLEVFFASQGKIFLPMYDYL
jgi:hypothetical protein